jgi:hypothetical protein
MKHRTWPQSSLVTHSAEIFGRKIIQDKNLLNPKVW